MDFIFLGLGIAAAGYFIGRGLENFKNPDATHSLGKMWDEQAEDGFSNYLIPEQEVHHHIGLSKEDAQALINEFPDIPHVKVNGKVYYHRQKLRQWLGEKGS
ncbi:DNA-binding protein [Salipaludibacillus aurantiacus]|uniref:DNA-binding protein n=1 Tax=Salipaludibacillus aurantiacus TaxID=1601833 RepID=A0A1H9W0J4_9BACI|nr:DNA-binding protein [Salipaludibacillus aurantiacus]SES27043.1 hypothetical protein SAMN05518684_11389 [Salipaludibacillus aurantiacus]